jgi:hypothetical protein
MCIFLFSTQCGSSALPFLAADSTHSSADRLEVNWKQETLLDRFFNSRTGFHRLGGKVDIHAIAWLHTKIEYAYSANCRWIIISQYRAPCFLYHACMLLKMVGRLLLTSRGVGVQKVLTVVLTMSTRLLYGIMLLCDHSKSSNACKCLLRFDQVLSLHSSATKRSLWIAYGFPRCAGHIIIKLGICVAGPHHGTRLLFLHWYAMLSFFHSWGMSNNLIHHPSLFPAYGVNEYIFRLVLRHWNRSAGFVCVALSVSRHPEFYCLHRPMKDSPAAM